MVYSLRKLIAFVFLGFMFWYIYQDLSNLNRPSFMNSLALIVCIFAVFLFVVPWLVVRMRIFQRVRQNRLRHEQWRLKVGKEGPRPLVLKKRQNQDPVRLVDSETLYFHEKGTLYVHQGDGFDNCALNGLPSDVAFPHLRKNNRRIQRTHLYLSDRALYFRGKSVEVDIPFSMLRSVCDSPGGIVLTFERDGHPLEWGFTVQDPLIFLDVLRFVRTK